MANNTRNRWDIKRFIETLNYFDIIPFIGTFPKWLCFNKSEQKGKEQSMGVILVLGSMSAVGQQVISQLLAKNYQVRTIVQDVNKAQELFNEKIEVIQANESNFDLMKQVNGIICCFDSLNSDEQQLLKNSVELFQGQNRAGEKLLFDFTKPNENMRSLWGAVDDVVMGGVSESNLRFVRERAIFSGNVSIANNGGFASVRTRNFNPPLDLSNYEGIQLRIEGDGKRYKFITRCEGKWDGLSYCYSFDTIYNFPQTLQIPFKELIPVFRAKTVSNAGEFDSSKVYSFQLMHSKFEYDGALNPRFSPGLFGLEIESIKAYGGQQNTSQLIVATPEYNTTVESILKNSELIYTLIHYLPSTSINKVSQSCIQALENPQLGCSTINL
ncbi:NADH:ubiquinone oxidoreductase [Aphanothece hegewaldii CCALA 016]|uniref:NADH:ubiquinone oxidoreductase n=1 Tax=Aphanothece hegewaldii CCALA 016 TaxID=2107694 RepID=A0A2T1LXX6_9CHRO|nr:CIA30 family protein [Aphanothece hegewaldii]PSF37211.1 NADH:ubiquinone oxidoreductase [Aphanothece hegewaldii CCALA 016]